MSQWVLKQDMTLALQRVPKLDVPGGAVRHDTGIHSLPQPGQELSAERTPRLGYGSEDVRPFGIFTRKMGTIPDTFQVGVETITPPGPQQSTGGLRSRAT